MISLAPDGWVKCVTQSPDVLAREILACEFQWISRESDVVVRVYHPQIGEFLVLNELQLRFDTRLPLRMRAYAALAEVSSLKRQSPRSGKPYACGTAAQERVSPARLRYA